jgi:hypothetical protein
MRELSQHIRLIPVGAGVTDPFDLMADQPFSLDIQADSDDNGTYWKLDRHITVDMPTPATLEFFRYGRSCQVQLWDTQGNTFVLGTTGIPAKATLSAFLNKADLQLHCELLNNPLR